MAHHDHSFLLETGKMEEKVGVGILGTGVQNVSKGILLKEVSVMVRS